MNTRRLHTLLAAALCCAAGSALAAETARALPTPTTSGAEQAAAAAPAASTAKESKATRKDTLLASRAVKPTSSDTPSRKDPFETPLFKQARPLY